MSASSPTVHLRKLRKRLGETSLFGASLTFTAGLTYALVPIATLGVAVLCIHEAGHYVVALSHNGDPRLPVFVPLGIFVVGITYLRNRLPTELHKAVALAGPFAGATAALCFGVAGALVGWSLLSLLALVAFVSEASQLVLGRDGRVMDERAHG